MHRSEPNELLVSRTSHLQTKPNPSDPATVVSCFGTQQCMA